MIRFMVFWMIFDDFGRIPRRLFPSAPPGEKVRAQNEQVDVVGTAVIARRKNLLYEGVSVIESVLIQQQHLQLFEYLSRG